MTGDTDDDRDDLDDLPFGSIFAALSELLDAVDDPGVERRTGSVTRGRARLDYDIDIGTLDPGAGSRRDRRGRDTSPDTDDHEYRVRVDESTGEAVVVADLPAVSAADVDVETSGDTLEIRVDGRVVASVSLALDGATVEQVTFRNQLLEVRVAPSDDSDGDDAGETDQ